jgi:transcriptional regulator GlxA family with amidase domain
MSETSAHKVAVLALDDVVPFDLGIPCEVFGLAKSSRGEPAYRVLVCSERRKVRTGAFGLDVKHGLDQLAHADTVVIPGVAEVGRPISRRVIGAIRAAWANGARVASICMGAFVLAETGLLDGRRATTHWRGAAELASRFPAVTVDPNVLFVDEGRIVTSAGASAGLDMCLHLVGRDQGQASAADAARLAVAPLRRDGGQAQFIRYELPSSSGGLSPVLDWMLANLDQPLDLAVLASKAVTSPRTFTRRFRDQTGTTPLRWVLAARVRRAQEMLETTSRSIGEIAMATGFESPVTFRMRFQAIVGVGPGAYRQRFADASGA